MSCCKTDHPEINGIIVEAFAGRLSVPLLDHRLPKADSVLPTSIGRAISSGPLAPRFLIPRVERLRANHLRLIGERERISIDAPSVMFRSRMTN